MIMLVGGIEAGGTKIVYGTAEVDGKEIHILERKEMPTDESSVVIDKLNSYFKENKITSLGLASFGPLELNKNSSDYGMVMGTPKKGWDQVPFGAALKEYLQIPVEIDTDVNAAAMAEVVYGAGKGSESLVYITVGTGIGMGLWVNGAPVHGLLHPEAGHMGIVRHEKDHFAGICPFHVDKFGKSFCLEGVAAGPAIEKRWGRPGKELSENAAVWEMEADYLAQGIANLILVTSPEKIILGGGVMHQKELFPLIHKKVQDKLGGYIHRKEILTDIDSYIVPPVLGDNAGIMGAFLLAQKRI